MSSPRSEPVTLTAENHKSPHCGHELGGFPFSQGSTRYPDYEPDSPSVVPTHGPLVTAAKEGGLSAMEELKLLKTQVQDVSRVCQAVARGDLSQKITVPVEGNVMIQLKEVINTSTSGVSNCMMLFSLLIFMICRSTNSDNSQRK